MSLAPDVPPHHDASTPENELERLGRFVRVQGRALASGKGRTDVGAQGSDRAADQVPRGGVNDLSVQAWWTEADAAELDVLVHELVRVAMIHRERCSVCRGHGVLYCADMGEAIEAVLEWRDARILRSKAAWLRIRQQAREDIGVAA